MPRDLYQNTPQILAIARLFLWVSVLALQATSWISEARVRHVLDSGAMYSNIRAMGLGLQDLTHGLFQHRWWQVVPQQRQTDPLRWGTRYSGLWDRRLVES